MERMDRGKFLSATYPYSCVIQPRYEDLDPIDHINHVAIISYFQEGRVRLLKKHDIFAKVDGKAGSVVAGMQVEYITDLHYPAPIEMRSGFTRLGRTSFTLMSVLVQKEVVAAIATHAMVMTNEQGPVALPPSVRSIFEANMVSFQ